MDAAEPNSSFPHLTKLPQIVRLQCGVATTAVHVEEHCAGALERVRRLRPAISEHARFHKTRLIQATFQQQAAGIVFVHAGRVTGSTRHKHNLFRCVHGQTSCERDGEEEQTHDYDRGFLGSRFCLSSSAVSSHWTPCAGTSALAIQRSALSTTLRKFSLPQLTWRWPPVNPKPRPPSGRSLTHIMISSRPLPSTIWGYGP